MPELLETHLTVDLVLTAPNEEGENHILLIRRSKNSDAYPGYPALPGGYVDRYETFRQSILREVREETGINVPPKRIRRVGFFDHPERDPRGRMISIAYAGTLDHIQEPVAGDDADAADWVPLSLFNGRKIQLAFDHNDILEEALPNEPAILRTLTSCPGCRVIPGEYHEKMCDHALCPECGDQDIACGESSRPALWHGASQAAQVARELNWWTYANDLGRFIEDHARVITAEMLGQITWNPDLQRYSIGMIDESELDRKTPVW